MRFYSRVCLLAFVSVAILPLPALAHEADKTVLDPGFRPYSEYASAFVNRLDEATIAVHPTLIRGPVGTSHSVASQKKIIASIGDKNLWTAIEGSIRVDLGRLEARSQWELFLNDIERISETLKGQPPDADYHLFLELMSPVSNRIFGIHCYVFDRRGRNAFSFLLNSHHRLFADAKLSTRQTSENALTKLVEKATDVAVVAFRAQVDRAGKGLAKATDTRSIKAKEGVLDDFESGLPSGINESEVRIGFVTFSDQRSTAKISTTVPPSPTPDKGSGKALKLDLDVISWAAFAHLFENDIVDQWVSYDWSDFNQFSFWLYGRNSGNSLFVHILDNRKPSSTVDDAERIGYEFTDDFSGWKKVTIRFADMRRKEVGNGAPVDGLGLSAVHGWAFGTLNTGGPITYYLDKFELRNVPSRGAEFSINELPMFGHIQKTAKQQQSDKRFLEQMTRNGRSPEAAADYVARVGWSAFNQGDRSLAIKRFNQAWLLNPKNQFALWGFAAICMDRGQVEEAVRYYRMAIDSGPENSKLQKDYEDALRRLKK
jgi:hypothetical protein